MTRREPGCVRRRSALRAAGRPSLDRARSGRQPPNGLDDRSVPTRQASRCAAVRSHDETAVSDQDRRSSPARDDEASERLACRRESGRPVVARHEDRAPVGAEGRARSGSRTPRRDEAAGRCPGSRPEPCRRRRQSRPPCPSGLKLASTTASAAVCPRSAAAPGRWPPPRSRAVPSLLAVINMPPSGLNETVLPPSNGQHLRDAPAGANVPDARGSVGARGGESRPPRAELGVGDRSEVLAQHVDGLPLAAAQSAAL